VRVKQRGVDGWRGAGCRASGGSEVRGGCIGAGSCKGHEAGASRLGLRLVFAAVVPCGTGAVGVGCRWRTGGSRNWVGSEGRLGPLGGGVGTAAAGAGGVGTAAVGAGGSSDGSAEMRLVP
jgi:hypothetical protein